MEVRELYRPWSPIRAILLGATGQLGQAIVEVWSKYLEVVIVPREIDIRDSDELYRFIKDHLVDALKRVVVVNCAAMTDVDRCEESPNLAMEINYEAVRELVTICESLRVNFIHVGTDFVFDGKTPPYHEEKKPNPINQYGKSKLKGEKVVLDKNFWVYRVSWLFGKDGRDFPSRLLHQYLQGERHFRVAYDLVGTPTWAVRAAHVILHYHGFFHLYSHNRHKLLHATNSGSISKFELARYCFQTLGIKDVVIEPILSSEFGSLAPRPKNTTMSSIILARRNLGIRHFFEDLQTYLRLLYNKYNGLRSHT